MHHHIIKIILIQKDGSRKNERKKVINGISETGGLLSEENNLF